ncbi:5-keto-4-deoxy-D-glucarate aldolase [Striga asiatica]|uniref:5-keto-4-deoxy-D-glucarate aldolase n=1 Tax=Striga asiatica TaxID=4170 RepID=A0A5A7QQ71_STRAF|nr:5-keto-4-deoxy-D-glucarate aldolase [Striga asiatica]
MKAQDEAARNYDNHDGLLLFKWKVYMPNCGQVPSAIIGHLYISKVGDFVARSDEYQQVKVDSWRSSGLLLPLPIPDRISEDVTVNFIERLPLTNGFDGVMVVVDQLAKYAHFIQLTHPYTAKSIAKLFVEYVVKLHGVPRSIVSEQDQIFMSNFWKEFFKMHG